MNKKSLLLYGIADPSVSGENKLYESVEKALQGGVTMIQYRQKPKPLEPVAILLKNLCAKYKVPFIINDDVELAKKIDADGVHVGQSDMTLLEARKILGPNKIIGVTAKTIEQARIAEKNGADYLGSGAVFGTSTKKDAKPMELTLFREICKSVNIPVVAIGGVNESNIDQLENTSLSGVAIVSGIFGKADVKETSIHLKEKIIRIVEGAKSMKAVLTIAGSDSSGGAGIQADIKTMTANGVYAMSAITALTAQNTMGVTSVMESTPKFLEDQLDSIFADIYPDAIKTGMVSSSELIHVIAQRLSYYHAKNIVVDPVMVATSGTRLIAEEAIDTLKKELLPLATLITPNIPEAEVLSEMKISDSKDMEVCAKSICEKYGCNVLLKGGHNINDANDLLYSKEKGITWFEGKHINNSNTHGTGCTLSSAIASNLAKGHDLETSILYAKNYISGALGAMLDLGKGSGPMNHAFAIKGDYSWKKKS